MKKFMESSLYILPAAGVVVAIYMATNWSAMPVLQRMAGLMFILLDLHAMEEYRFPGGFIQMEERSFNVSFPRPEVNEFVLVMIIFYTALVPFFFSHVAWLVMAPMVCSIIQLPSHLGAARKMKRFYSPGLVTAILMVPIWLYTIIYIVQNNLMRPVELIFSILYFFIPFGLSSVVIIKMNGLKVSDFKKKGARA
ncbi:MAG: HXXEE domain-containing protein [Desulfatitalea sp.]|nr:HXXEE domain-containing protein [Desulfatitalea sp.]NNJ99957.1 HXXEE domain-containing protein [Desulfatitalea sp.]